MVSMTRLVSIALYDPDGVVAPFVRHTIEELSRPDTTIVATSTHPLADDDASWVRERADLIERANTGLDLYSHRLVLERFNLGDFDEVVVTNDTYALLQPIEVIERAIDPATDFWGLTISREGTRHVQSFFVDFRSKAIRHPGFLEHWRKVEPGGRDAMIHQGELGLSRALRRAGLLMEAAYRPSASDRRQATIRTLRNRTLNPMIVLGGWNASMATPEAALDGRMPMVKISTLRYDPYRVGADRLLSRLEAAYPAAMDGVRDYLDRTADAYGLGPDRRPWRAR